jgi:hypothetical protein
MASSVAASLRALASASTSASLTKPTTPTSPFLVLLAPTPPCLLRLRSARRLPLAPLAASDSFESSVGIDYAEPAAAEGAESEEAFASGEDEEDAAVGEEEEVGEYVEPPEEAKVYVGNLPYDVDSERLAQLFEQAGVVEVSEVRLAVASMVPPPYMPCIMIASTVLKGKRLPQLKPLPPFCSGFTFSQLYCKCLYAAAQ